VGKEIEASLEDYPNDAQERAIQLEERCSTQAFRGHCFPNPLLAELDLDYAYASRFAWPIEVPKDDSAPCVCHDESSITSVSERDCVVANNEVSGEASQIKESRIEVHP
jgi:hypothetical protein